MSKTKPFFGKDHFHVPRKSKQKQRPAQADLMENWEDFDLREKIICHSKTKTREDY